MTEPEYHEGPAAAERFEKMATALFRAPKTETVKKIKKKAARKRRKASKG